MSLEETVVFRRCNTIKLEFNVVRAGGPWNLLQSKQYQIKKSATFQLLIKSYSYELYLNKPFKDFIYFRFHKMRQDDPFRYMIKICSDKFQIENNKFVNNETWQYLQSKEWRDSVFDLTVIMDIIPSVSRFQSFFEDTELTDFELRGDDGSVQVHKLVLAANSPVLRRMLSGTWREMSEGHVEIDGISKLTLQHFKEYLYLHQLPDVDLISLLQLAHYYMMPELEQKCVDKIVENMTAENVFEILEFTAKTKMSRLLVAILDDADSQKIREKLLQNIDTTEEAETSNVKINIMELPNISL